MQKYCPEKICSRCKQSVPTPRFIKTGALADICFACLTVADNRSRSHGITLERYNGMIAAQEGRCAICKRPTKNLVIDHDRSCCPGPKGCSRCVRGLLCEACNSGLGFFGDKAEVLLGAVQYLLRRDLPKRRRILDHMELLVAFLEAIAVGDEAKAAE